MFKPTIKNYTILFYLTIVLFIAVIISIIAVPSSLQGYGGLTTAIIVAILVYHIFFYSKELKKMKQEQKDTPKK